MRISKLAVAVFSVMVASACTTGGEKGNPTPAPQSNTSSGSDSGSKIPERPQALKLDSIDTCKLLTAEQMKQISAVSADPVQLDLVEGKESPSCDYGSDGGFGYQVGAVTHDGVSYWLKGGGNVDAKVIKVGDFGAVEVKLKGGSGFDCSVAIDVADGQQLMVSYIPTTTKEKDQAVLCGKAEKAAGLALSTLKTLK
ncbi:DUF3558 domain-containing protein [Lentzea sp. BCCO 10_0798]|uniref:DUF3558 domain-containing protein n=1 Tax=Lentzea kristufekii TaxID=3095430 RepID=A0ABU4TML7_9PSEU|nr:DUF3558 domain-containing protein [Lentzea sp. BCCO 10_0798]MDX8049167.1 DUF3558 domain-containing protein [Lentzea sp. BCCO 10_0798]